MILKKMMFGMAIGTSMVMMTACGSNSSKGDETADETKSDSASIEAAGSTGAADLPAPTDSHTKISNVIGWPDGKVPTAPAGFSVTKFAGDLDNPRNIYVAPNGDIFIAESATAGAKKMAAAAVSGKLKSQNFGSADRITLFRDANKDGVPESRTVFAEGLNQPYGMLIVNNAFYVGNTDGLMQFSYKLGDTKLTGKGKKIVELPAGGYNNHWTRNLIANTDGSKIYISVGSGSNVAEHGIENEARRANILEINPDGSGERIYGSGLRNPVGLGWAPGTSTLWTAVNERDELGDELVPDYATSVKDGGFYGWPYSYYGQHEDPRMKGQRPDLVKSAIVPDVPLGSHTASLGLAFYTGNKFPEKYRNGMFIGQHGSWNSSALVGYKVVFVPFKGGKPSGKPEDFLTGFIADSGKGDVYGRPVGVAVLADGSMLVADDAANTIWRIAAQ